LFGVLVGVEALKTVGLEWLFDKFSERISVLSVEFQAVFLEDLETAVENRLKVLESASLSGYVC
jgi:hypothetical protein